jgi:hypothetical protein
LTSSDGIPALKEFFSDILFSPPVGKNALPTLKSLTTKLQGYVKDLEKSKNMSDADFKAAHGGLDRNDYAYLTGQIAGTLSSALGETLTSIKNSADQVAQDQAEVINTAIDSVNGLLGMNTYSGAGGNAIGPWLKLWANRSARGAGDNAVTDTINDLNSKGIHIEQANAAAMNDTAGLLDTDDPALDWFNKGLSSSSS